VPLAEKQGVGSTTQEEEYPCGWEKRRETRRGQLEVYWTGAATITRISWGAIFAGTVVALVAQLLLTMLGLAIGLTIIEPPSGQTPWQGVGIGAGIWWMVSALISLFLGGWTVGRLAGMPLRQDAILHGIIVWGLITLISFYLVITGAGAVIGGALNVVSRGCRVSAGSEALYHRLPMC
jgi:hypothetical protein